MPIRPSPGQDIPFGRTRGTRPVLLDVNSRSLLHAIVHPCPAEAFRMDDIVMDCAKGRDPSGHTTPRMLQAVFSHTGSESQAFVTNSDNKFGWGKGSMTILPLFDVVIVHLRGQAHAEIGTLCWTCAEPGTNHIRTCGPRACRTCATEDERTLRSPHWSHRLFEIPIPFASRLSSHFSLLQSARARILSINKPSGHAAEASQAASIAAEHIDL